MEEMLKTYLIAPDESDLKLIFRASAGKSGQTELTLYADTGYRFWSTQTKGNKKVEYAGYRDTPEVVELFESLAGSGFWSQAGTGMPGDVQITLSAQGLESSATPVGAAGKVAVDAIDKLIRAIAPEVIR